MIRIINYILISRFKRYMIIKIKILLHQIIIDQFRIESRHIYKTCKVNDNLLISPKKNTSLSLQHHSLTSFPCVIVSHNSLKWSSKLISTGMSSDCYCRTYRFYNLRSISTFLHSHLSGVASCRFVLLVPY